jgi:hypothetical protein
MRRLIRSAVRGLVLAGLILVIGIFFFLGPIALICETWELLRMDETTNATIVSSRVGVGARVGRARDNPRPIIEYDYMVAGQAYRSSRLMPGFLGNVSGWPKTERIFSDYQVGQVVPIYYGASDPARAVLFRGWFRASMLATAFVWGILAIEASRRWMRPQGWRVILTSLGVALLIYGVIVLFRYGTVIPREEGGWHLLTILAAWCLGAIVFAVVWQKRDAASGELDQPNPR